MGARQQLIANGPFNIILFVLLQGPLLEKPRSWIGTAQYGDTFVLIGGQEESSKYSNSVFMFDPDLLAWKTIDNSALSQRGAASAIIPVSKEQFLGSSCPNPPPTTTTISEPTSSGVFTMVAFYTSLHVHVPQVPSRRPAPISGGHWVLVVGGWDDHDSSSTVELVSLDPQHHPVPACLKHRSNFPAKWHKAAGYSNSAGR